MEGPISSVVVEVPAMNFSRKFGDATEHITTRSDGGFDLQEDPATVLFFFSSIRKEEIVMVMN